MWLKPEKKILKIVRVIVRAVSKKRCFEKNAFSFVAVWETPDTPQEKREIEQKKKISSMKPFASYSRRFKLNFKPKKTEFLKNLHWCCPLSNPQIYTSSTDDPSFSQ